jgi:hypothetical protein
MIKEDRLREVNARLDLSSGALLATTHSVRLYGTNILISMEKFIMKEFKGKVTVVIGAVGGIGLANAVRCAQERMGPTWKSRHSGKPARK